MTTRARVQNALQSGMEVTIHQAPIVESRWNSAGFFSIHPQTGSGAYTIEGGSNGGVLLIFGAIVFAIGIYGTAVALAPALILVAAGIFFMFAAATIFQSSSPNAEEDGCNFFTTAGVNLLALALGLLITGTIGIMLGVIAALLLSLPSTSRGVGNLCAR